MKGRVDDGEWIAQQGRKWADKTLGNRDMEVYLFRLLLEWGRLIDDARDKLDGFRDERGNIREHGWPAEEVSSGDFSTDQPVS